MVKLSEVRALNYISSIYDYRTSVQYISERCYMTNNGIMLVDAYIDRLRDEMRKTEAETASLSDEIDSLRKLYVEGVNS